MSYFILLVFHRICMFSMYLDFTFKLYIIYSKYSILKTIV